ncbi:MAG: hypothetical protein AB8B99_06065 [Phormidesmis sp.]
MESYGTAPQQDESSEASKANGNQSTLGVLIIHGIGDQKTGETLIGAASPLFRWFQARHSNDSQRVSIIESHLREDSDTPAHTCFEITTEDEQKTSIDRRLLLVEGLWANAFYKPKFTRLAFWSFIALPSVVASQFARGLMQIGRQGGRIQSYPRLTLLLIGHFGLLLLAVIIQVLIILLLPLALVPGLGKSILAVQNLLASFIGDSFIFVSDPIQRSSIITRVAESLDWMAPKCDRIIVLAHSQGAAIAHQLLISPIANKHKNKISLLLTFGSGLGKLYDLKKELDKKNIIRLFGLFFLLSSVVCLLKLPAYLYQISLPLNQRSLDIVAYSILWAAFVPWLILLIYFQYRTDERVILVEQFPCEQIKWVDCYADKDIVPAGALLDIDKIESRPITNERSFISDHVTYWQNIDEFVGYVGNKLATELGLELRSQNSVSSDISCRRRWRYDFRQSVFWLLLLSYIVSLWYLYPDFLAWGESSLIIGNQLLALVPDWLYDTPTIELTSISSGIAGALQVGIGFWLLWVLLRSAWRLWQWRDVNRSLRNQVIDAGGWAFVLFVVLASTFPAIFIWYLFNPTLWKALLVGRSQTFWLIGSTTWFISAAFSALFAVIPGDSDFAWQRVCSLYPLSALLSIAPAYFIATLFSAGSVGVWGVLTNVLYLIAASVALGALSYVIALLGYQWQQPLTKISTQYGKRLTYTDSQVIFWFGPFLGVLAILLKRFFPTVSLWPALIFTTVFLMGIIASAHLNSYTNLRNKKDPSTMGVTLKAAVSLFVTTWSLIISLYF